MVARIAIAGCAGRMGRTIANVIAGTDGTALAGGFDHPGFDGIGRELNTGDSLLTVSPDFKSLAAESDVLIDFTIASATLGNLEQCLASNTACVIGTTGFSDDENKKIEEIARQIPIVKSGNMSLGVNMLLSLVERAAASLSDDFDIEIHEAHHRHKVDAPSGTALMLGEAAAGGRGVRLDAVSDRGRDGITGARKKGDIGFSVTRAGGIIGEHSVAFGSEAEVITLSHSALDRSLFAKGAVAAAKWVQDKEPGLYSMKDVLGL